MWYLFICVIFVCFIEIIILLKFKYLFNIDYDNWVNVLLLWKVDLDRFIDVKYLY